MGVTDCPDGLARCAEGTVEVSRLVAIPRPCGRPENGCACPWEPVATCRLACVSEGVEVAIERSKRPTQLCNPETDAGFIEPTAEPRAGACDEGQLYRCHAGDVVDCGAHVIAGSCIHGCVADGSSIDEDARGVTREVAFAILCSR